MGDRGNCKVFAPNYFNPTKCQNCFKQKEQHSVQDPSAIGASGTSGSSGVGGRNVVVSKQLLKESVLLKAHLGRDKTVPETWERHWFALYANGELQEYAIVDGQINKDKVSSSVMLQDFIRMLDGKAELGEELCFGVKTLRDTIYFKTTTKVDYENWWKEISSFVASPLKRTTSASVPKTSITRLNRPTLCKQLSVPISSISPGRSSRSSSISSLQSDPENPQIESLRSQVLKLEEENDKLLKMEEQRRKLELEVNYWKEYVTNAQLLKRSGGTSDTVTELADARRRLIQLQDELNQSQKKLKSNTGKLLMKNKEVTDCKEKLRESNSIIAVYKAKIDQLSKELTNSNRNESPDTTSGSFPEVVSASKVEKEDVKLKKSVDQVDYFDPPGNASNLADARHLEDKFLLLKDKLKRIERELLIKSKELEKANESRSKVAKYTRSLLQELETRLRDNQQKLSDTEDKLKNSNVELSMERERRMKLEEGPRRRMSNIVSPVKPLPQSESFSSPIGCRSNPTVELTEHDADTKYADYYRSRFKEAEASLLEKDKKLHQAEEKIKDIQSNVKHNSDSYKVINDMQTKLSDATHKLSDRQLKIHELTCEVDRLKKFEKTYGKKRQQCGTLEDIVKDLELANAELTRNLHHVKQELEMLKIREVVLKEQLQTFADDSEESDSDDDGKLGKSVDLKKKIECMIDLESRCKKFALDNEKLIAKNEEYDLRLRNLNMQNFNSLEASKEIVDATTDGATKITEQQKKIKELEQSKAADEEKFCSQLTAVKEQYINEISTLEKKSANTLSLCKEEISTLKLEIDNLLLNKSEMEVNLQQLTERVSAYEQEVKLQRPADVEQIQNVLSKEREMAVRSSKLSDNTETSEEKIKNESREDIGRVPTDSTGKDRDSGIVITQEIKCLIDAAKSNNMEVLTDDVAHWSADSKFNIPHDSVSEIDIIEKYKMVCSKFQVKMRELGSKYVVSEEKNIELAQTLEKKTTSEQAFILEYDILLGRVDELESQIIESQELLQSKADELEKERKNVIHLVEVTSAYIKELEDSLEESKSKIGELQSTKHSDTAVTKPAMMRHQSIYEESESELHEYDAADGDGDEAVVIRQKLTAKIMTLQSDISEITDSHAREIERMKSESQKEIEYLQNKLSENKTNNEDEKLRLQIESLETALNEQNQSYSQEVEMLSEHFQAELKQAFCGDNAGIDMLNRMQELEIEVEQVRKHSDAKIKELEENHEKEKAQMKDDMATVLQATMSGSFNEEFSGGYESANVEELEERIIKLEQELVDMEQKYKDDLELEKNAHQDEMEDTIRDMMMVRNASTRYDDPADETDVNKDSEDDAGSTPPGCSTCESRTISFEQHEKLKVAHEEELQKLEHEHEEELGQIRSDFTFVISSLRQGTSSDTIMELQERMKNYEQEAEELKREHKKETSAWELKFKRSESANFFAVRRNEEMGGKIYNMQIELEELDRNHQMEISSYQEKLRYMEGGGDDGDDVTECVQQNCDLKEKNKLLEKELEDLHTEYEQRMESTISKLQEEKQVGIKDMTDKVLKLESLIDELKETHIRDLKAFEKSDRDETMEAVTIEKERVKELETMCEKLKVEYEIEIEELAKEHKKEVEKLRVFYEKEIGDMKRRMSSGDDSANRKTSVDYVALKQTMKEQKELHEKELKKLKSNFASEREASEKQHQSDINDIRSQYDEKLKMTYKEGLRRQSVTERKSDGTRMRQLISEKETISTKLLELEIQYENDMKQKTEKISEMEKLLTMAKTNPSNQTIDPTSICVNFDSEISVESEVQKKVKEVQEQIERYHRRIEYYREKSARENTEESHRVAELQSEIVELTKEMEKLNGSKKKRDGEKEDKEKEPTVRVNSRKSVDGAPPRRHTEGVTVKPAKKRGLDPRKRWSNLEETSEKDDGKSGSVLARKTLWENKSTDTTT